jgi:hypothetical protein
MPRTHQLKYPEPGSFESRFFSNAQNPVPLNFYFISNARSPARLNPILFYFFKYWEQEII